MEQEQGTMPKKRGRPPKTEMTELRKKQSVEEDNSKLADFGLLDNVSEKESIGEPVMSEKSENCADENIPKEVSKESSEEVYSYGGEMNSHLTTECIERFSKAVGKSYNYVKSKVLNQSCVENVIANVLDMVSESCLPVHKYNIGDWVYIPEQTVDNTQGGFGVIQVKFLRKPKKVQVNKIIYTNKIQYSFVGFKKLIVLEDYCCSTEAQCKLLCDRLNK